MADEDVDPLEVERRMIRETVLRIDRFGIKPEANRKKNITDSVKYRKQGNALYNNDSHNSEIHEQILELYSKSIALAPFDSEELGLAYGNRSALLLHLKKYEECIKDCDRAANITVSDYLEAKLLCRKAECLAVLNSKMFKYVCEEALQLFKQLELAESVKSKFIGKLNNLKNSFSNKKSEQNNTDTEELYKTLYSIPTFVKQKEAPCASEAVAIRYNEEWGRHIVATRKIEPGEIIAVEKSYYSFMSPKGMYLYCSNCVQLAWSSIPCKHCIYGVYCSEKCRTEAWDKFHQFECKVYPLVWDIDEDIRATPCSLRLLLIAVHEVGGIKEMKKEFMDLAKHKDPRTTGFSADGVFHSDRCRSVLSLAHNPDRLDSELKDSLSTNAAVALYYLLDHSTFFGKKLDWSSVDLLLSKDHDVWFIGALLLRIFFLIPRNGLQPSVQCNHTELEYFRGMIMLPFFNLFNHSCDPNMKYIYSKNNEVIGYAAYPIEEGEQLFYSYHCDFLDKPTEERQSIYSEKFHFECKCLPCKENWSDIDLPLSQDMLESDPELRTELAMVFVNLRLVNEDPSGEKSKYSPELMEEIVMILKALAEMASVHCADYRAFEQYMHVVYRRSFGLWHIIPDTC